MASQDFLDFDLRLERGPDGTHRAIVVQSPAGHASGTFTLPFSQDRLQLYLLQIGQRTRGVRRLESPASLAARQFGTQLFETVFAGDIREVWSRSLAEARRQDRGLRLRLRLNDAPDLADLPWEFLYEPRDREFLLLSAGTPLVHYLELPERIQPLQVQPPLRILVMVSSPTDHDPLDVEQEWQRLNTALAPLSQRGLLRIDRLTSATLPALQSQLRQGEYHIFHFIGHGGFDSQGTAPEGVLLLEDDHQRGRKITGRDLAIYLRDEDTLRLVVLNCCEGARTSPTDLFAGVAQTLVRRGIPAVIAMQFEISDTAAVGFATEFYRALADGWPVDAALGEARKGLYGAGHAVEWGTPVLHLRAPDGRIFDVAPPSPDASPEKTRIDNLLTQARQSATSNLWSECLAHASAILALNPHHPEARELQDRARNEHQFVEAFTRAQRSFDTGRWEDAVAALHPLVQQRPDHTDARRLLDRARERWRDHVVGPPPNPHPTSTPQTQPPPSPPPRPGPAPAPAPAPRKSRSPLILAGALILVLSGVIVALVWNQYQRQPTSNLAQTSRSTTPEPSIPIAHPTTPTPPLSAPSTASPANTPVSPIDDQLDDPALLLDEDETFEPEPEPQPDPPPRRRTLQPIVEPERQPEPPPTPQPAGMTFQPASPAEPVGYWQVNGWEQDPGQPRRTVDGKVSFNFLGTFSMLFRYDGIRTSGEGVWTYFPATSVLQLQYPGPNGFPITAQLRAFTQPDGFLLEGANQGTTTHLEIRPSTAAAVLQEVQDTVRETFGVP